MAGPCDVFSRWLVHIHPMRMGVIDTEELQMAPTEFRHDSRDVAGRHHIISNRIRRNILRWERARDYVSLPGQNAAAFAMRLAASMRQDLAKHFATTSDGWDHC